MKAVIIGPGRIGCGFAGELLYSSGYEIVFIARNPKMVEHFNRVGCYRVALTSQTDRRESVVEGIRAVDSGDTRAVARAIAQADVIVTSVGPQNLSAVAPSLAAGLKLRSSPATVLAFENLVNAGSFLRRLVSTALRGKAATVDHGFSGALVSRAVTQRIGQLESNEPLLFVGDTHDEFIVHGPSLRTPVPKIKGMTVKDNYGVWVLRKLYMFSAGHAVAAYLGSLKGYHFIHTAVRDPEIRRAVLQAMAEGQKGLSAKFGRDFAGDEQELRQILVRFENSALNDPIQRVGRDPRRKLGANERLVGAAKLAEKAGVPPHTLALAAAAAFCFCNSADPSCNELQDYVNDFGVDAALHQICGLDSESSVGRSVAKSWEQLASGWHPGNFLVSLDRHLWAWSRAFAGRSRDGIDSE